MKRPSFGNLNGAPQTASVDGLEARSRPVWHDFYPPGIHRTSLLRQNNIRIFVNRAVYPIISTNDVNCVAVQSALPLNLTSE